MPPYPSPSLLCLLVRAAADDCQGGGVVCSVVCVLPGAVIWVRCCSCSHFASTSLSLSYDTARPERSCRWLLW
ncbi:hypothetical protein B0T26DRAFT_729872 [Lasiosphaeria miniovina]|uniref:Secreted protein n=1 Tax=Lasiosphaeria miniovina TaxID=1954250 RepID=A0AA39ZT64_9PEZI|nr:uncharacterized protein B0T26DRAFT_729872 [Lasiosphaeria miniovina]KAK0703125.1 hypothetical protein B0T26DRAFT_729872 [Lasiosphaeria miniovina]